MPHVECFGLVVNAGQHAVIWRDEVVLIAGYKNRASRSAYSGIDDNQMNGLGRKIGVGLGDGHCAIEDIVGQNVVADVDDIYFGIDAEDYALHYANQVVSGAVIRRQSNNWPRQVFLLMVLHSIRAEREPCLLIRR